MFSGSNEKRHIKVILGSLLILLLALGIMFVIVYLSLILSVGQVGVLCLSLWLTSGLLLKDRSE